MLDQIFSGILDGGTTSGLTLSGFLACALASLIIGGAFALAYIYKNSAYSKSFIVTLALLPATISVVIMMVSGSVGAGVAVAGSFSLIRFRSVPGTAKEICAVFISMAAGLAVGMGYIGFAALFSAIMAAAWIAYFSSGFGERKNAPHQRTLRITIPEDLDYTGVFDEVFAEYTREHRLTSVKTTNMGSLFKLTYDISLRDAGVEKQLIDQLRCRNGNLEISSSLKTAEGPEL